MWGGGWVIALRWLQSRHLSRARLQVAGLTASIVGEKTVVFAWRVGVLLGNLVDGSTNLNPVRDIAGGEYHEQAMNGRPIERVFWLYPCFFHIPNLSKNLPTLARGWGGQCFCSSRLARTGYVTTTWGLPCCIASANDSAVAGMHLLRGWHVARSSRRSPGLFAGRRRRRDSSTLLQGKCQPVVWLARPCLCWLSSAREGELCAPYGKFFGGRVGLFSISACRFRKIPEGDRKKNLSDSIVMLRELRW